MLNTFAEIFEGSPRGHGVFWLARTPDAATGKLRGKAATVAKTATLEDFQRHLNGIEPGIGIVPTTPEGKARWGCIDIDIYKDLDPRPLLRQIRDMGMPLVVCRSKSGGIHAFAFASEWVDAGLLQQKLEDWSGCLGHGGAEVWPKQKALANGTDFGNWVNLPYFGGDASPRRALSLEGELIELEAFLEEVRNKSFTESWLKSFEPKRPEVMPDGPPCLNLMLSGSKIPEGTRNRVLFAVGIYCKKSSDDWEAKLASYNTLHFDPPLPEREVSTVIGSLRKKDYFYTCSQEPLKTYCNRNACRLCKFGIGNAHDGTPVMGTLTKVDTDPPIYYLEVRNGAARLKLSAKELQSQLQFQLACITQLNVMPTPRKEEDWRELVNGLLQGMVVVEVAASSRASGLLEETIEAFCNVTGSDSNADVLAIGKAFYKDGVYRFRLFDLLKFIGMRRDKFERNAVVDQLRQMGGVTEKITVGSRDYDVWKLTLRTKPHALSEDSEDSVI